jgi:thiamine biosynthesis lipoprotein ApbE
VIPLTEPAAIQLRLRLVLIYLALACWPLSGPQAAGTTTVTRQAYLMGTVCAISGEAFDRQAGLAAIESAFRAIGRREALLSTWRDDTPLARLNREPVDQPLPVSAELLGLLGRAADIWSVSGGAFDPAIGRLVEAYGLRGARRRPGPEELAAARAASGMGLLLVDHAAGTVLRRPPGPLLDAGAFGKGDALAHAAAALEGSGLRGWVIDLGGQIVVDPRGEPRAVQVADPGRRGRAVAEFRLPAGMSAATSAGSERPGHILDPRTGRPAPDFGSVTVVSRDPLRADAFSTALYVLGPEEGLELAEELDDLEALFLIPGAAGLRLVWTPGMGALLNHEMRPHGVVRGKPSRVERGSRSVVSIPQAATPGGGGLSPELRTGATAVDPDRLSHPSEDSRVRELEQRVQELETALDEARESGTVADPATIKELERRIEVLSREIEKLKIGEAAVEATGSIHGLGPAASKVYGVKKGVSVGGYGELLYQNWASELDDGTPSDRKDQLDLLRAVFYFGYKFNDRILFNSELEYEHASTAEEGSVSVEFAYLDFLFEDRFNARAGLVLIPMGFVNELHEPPVFLGARRPDVERYLIPTTWRENGAGLFGDLGPVTYRAYLVTGLDGAGVDGDGFTARGLRGARQKGSKSLAEDFAFVGRVDWEITAGLILGGSYYTGDSGQGAVTPTTRQTIDARTEILDLHLEWRWRGIQARALWVDVAVEQVALLNEFREFAGDESIGEEMGGAYVQLGYDVLAAARTRQELIPFVRVESYDTQKKVPAGFSRDSANDVDVNTYGISYLPISKVVLKLEYQDMTNAAGTGENQWNIGVGWLF